MAPRRKSAPNDGLTEFQREAIREVLAEFPHVERAVLFGSRAMGTWSPASDVDLALYGAGLTVEDELSIAARMEDLGLLFMVDLVRGDAIQSETLREHIAREGRRFYPADSSDGDGGNVINTAKPLHTPSLMGELPMNWRWRRLDSVCQGIFDCPHSTPVVTERGPLMARSQDVRSGVFRAETAAHVSEETYRDRIRRAEPRFGDLLFSREGTYFGIAAEVPSGLRICLGQRMVLLRPDRSVANHRFLKYWLNSPVLAAHVSGRRDGSVAERLNLPSICALPVVQAPLDSQREIAHILGTLDDKIELNRKMNETLEAMARAIFQSWFVDFDPVHAKARGEQPAGISADLAAPFPSEFEDSELGPIPKDWQVKSIGEVVRVVGGSTPSTTVPSYWEGGTHAWATPKDLSGLRSPVLLATERRITDAGLSTISSGLLPKGVVLMSSRAPVGYVAISEVPVAINQGFIAMICDGPIPNDYVLHWLRHKMSEIHQRASGTTFQEISKQNFRPIHVVVPPSAIVEAFVAVARPLHRRLAQNEFACGTLEETRDLLLPKLVSGEIRVNWS